MTEAPGKLVPFSLHGDQPIETMVADRLGFGELAANIAALLVSPALADGMVIGIEGGWGTGKTSLANLIAERLGNMAGGLPCSLLWFRPPLIGDCDALAGNLLAGLATAIDAIEGDRAAGAAEKLRAFAVTVTTSAGRAGPLPARQKAALATALRDLGHRFIVVIDDACQPGPAAFAEVLRLVSAVADLPNVAYLLCHDGAVAAHSIGQAAGFEHGAAFLDKIVRLPVAVPQADARRLQSWFRGELDEIASPYDRQDRMSLDVAIHMERQWLRSPRDVNRVLDAVRFLWPPLAERGLELADLVWLQLIRNGNPAFYRWIQNCCNEIFSSLSDGDGPEGGCEIFPGREYASLIPEALLQDERYMKFLGCRLPFLEYDGEQFILQDVRANTMDRRSSYRRNLKNPDYYRWYFLVSPPAEGI